MAIRKVNSYEVPADPRSSVVISHNMKMSHKDSIIDTLTPLVSSKKLVEDTYKPEKLSETAQKRVEYWKTFAKFSP